MDPSTDIERTIQRADGTTLRVIIPGGNLQGKSANYLYTEDAFRKYESHIREAIANISKDPPIETQFAIPSGMSPNTFTARMRSALAGLKLYPTYAPDLHAQLLNLQQEFVVAQAQDGHSVWFRIKQRKGRAPSLVKQTISHRNPRMEALTATAIRHPSLSASELEAYCLLLGSRKLIGPIITSTHFPDDLIASLESRHDVSITWDDAASETTII